VVMTDGEPFLLKVFFPKEVFFWTSLALLVVLVDFMLESFCLLHLDGGKE